MQQSIGNNALRSNYAEFAAALFRALHALCPNKIDKRI
jgi:hypothetical protein